MAKKLFLASLMVLCATFSLPVLSKADGGPAVISLSPSSGSYKVGGTFNMVIYVDPGGGAMDTVRAKLSYPANLLQVQNFALNSIFSYQAGASSFDNTAGTFSWGAGIPGGVKTASNFGTITFKVIKDGPAQVSVNSSSMVLSGGQNVFNGKVNSASFTFLPAVVAKKPVTTNKNLAVKKASAEIPAPAVTTDTTPAVTTQIIPEVRSQDTVGSLLNAFPLFLTTIKWWAILLALLGIAILGTILYKAREKKSDF